MKVNKVLSLLIKKLIFFIQVISPHKSNELFVKYLKKNKVNIKGNPQFISQDVYLDGTDYSLIEIGSNSVISREVTILTHDFSLSRAKYKLEGKLEYEVRIIKPVKIGENSFIGAKSILLPGSQVGDNTIIGAGSVVKGKIPNEVVAAGNPCKVICTLQEYYLKQYSVNKEFIY